MPHITPARPPVARGRDLRGADLSGAFLPGLDLREGRMEGAILPDHPAPHTLRRTDLLDREPLANPFDPDPAYGAWLGVLKQ